MALTALVALLVCQPQLTSRLHWLSWRAPTSALLAWRALPLQPQVRLRRFPAPLAKVGDAPPDAAAAAKAFEFIGKLGLGAVKDLKPGEVPDTKEFVTSVTIKHDRVINAVDGGAVADYMRLPVEEYAIYDDRLMRKLPASEAGGETLFELRVPTIRPEDGLSAAKLAAKSGAQLEFQKYVLTLREEIQDPKTKEALGEENYGALEQKVDEALLWLDDNPSADIEEYVARRKEFIADVRQIVPTAADPSEAPARTQPKESKPLFMPKPRLQVRVRPGPESISLESVSASLFSAEDANLLPPNVTMEQVTNALRNQFNLGFNTTLAWSPAKGWGVAPDATRLSARTDVRFKIRLPPPFTKVPRAIVQTAIGLVMRFIGGRVLKEFAGYLERDYQRWCNGTRNLTQGLRNLPVDDDGYIVVPQNLRSQMERDTSKIARRLRQKQLNASEAEQKQLERQLNASDRPNER